MMVESWVEPKRTILMGLPVFNRVLKIPQRLAMIGFLVASEI